MLSLAWATPAGASHIELSGIDPIAQSYQIAITNPADRTNYPSVLLLTSATLDTTNPTNKNLNAPKGQIYLSLQMTSGPVQRSYRSPLEGQFFSGLTPLPAQALHYVVASGHSYVATRVNPINQANNPNGSTDDGMVDATYYFVVPIRNRRGTLVISPTRTVGVQYEGFYGFAPVSLNIGGPTDIPLSFPKKLTATAPASNLAAPVPGAPLANLLNVLETALAGLIVALALLTKRRRQQRRHPAQVFVTSPARQPSPPAHPVVAESPIPQPRPAPPMRKSMAVESDLRVDVLGPLSISPMLAPASDPVRAILSYLAVNNDHLFSLDEIQTAIWPLTDAGTDIKKPAMRNYMVDARKVVGERHLPTASGRAGYQLVNATTDWTEFQQLTCEATKASKDAGLVLRRQALDLVSGQPFTADTSRYFTWAFSSSFVYKMVAAVTTLAHDLGTQYVLASDLVTAEKVLRQGLLSDPASLTLWEDLTDVLLEATGQSLLFLHWKAASLVLQGDDVAALRARANG